MGKSGNLSSWEDAVRWLKAQPDTKALVEACFYDDPLKDAAERYFLSTEWKALQAYLPTVGRVLDIGAGRGISAYAFSKAGWIVDALEPDPSGLVGAGAILSLAASINLPIKVQQNWGEHLPYEDNTFDVVHGRQVLHHANDLIKLCSEAARVLKPGGTFIATREHVISRPDDLAQFLASHPLHFMYGGEHAYSLTQYKNAIEKSGIKLKVVLNPFNSDINLYPETTQSIKKIIKNKLHLPFMPLPNFALTLAAYFNNTPGRLYSFIGKKDV